MRGRDRSNLGFTLIEVIFVMAIAAILIGVGAMAWRPPAAQTYASGLRNLVLQSRFEAIRRNEPVMVSWESGVREFVVRVAGPSDWCGAPGQELKRSNAADIGRLTVTTTVVGNGALVWVPSGQARNCSRSAFSEDFAEIDDGRNVLRVVIGSAGKVEIE